MIYGSLIASISPPSIGFVALSANAHEPGIHIAEWRKHCTLDELRSFLLDFEAISPAQNWPMRDCILRVNGVFSRDKLSKHGLCTDSHHKVTVSKASDRRNLAA